MRAIRLFTSGLGLALVVALAPPAMAQGAGPAMFPANGAKNVNPDTHLVLTFPAPPTVGTSGFIRIYDAADNSLVDSIDMSIPPSDTPSGRRANADGSTTAPRPITPPPGQPAPVFQTQNVGGVDYRYFPIIVRDNKATIDLHNNKLKYGKKYVVKIDPSVLKPASGAFAGYASDTAWTFTTKAAPPAQTAERVVVAADGSGDFNTLQGALDWAPAKPAKRVTVFIRNGNYEELIYAANKSNLTIRGEDREKVVVGYANNSAFTPMRRWAFGLFNVEDVQLSTFTIRNYFIGQAEALMARGQRIVIDRMNLYGSGDAFTTYGSIYMVDSKLVGDGDTILAYATLFCLRCEVHSVGPVVWPRTPKGQRGNIFVNSTLIIPDKPSPWSITAANPKGTKPSSVFARLPLNGRDATNPASNFPNGEMVLINTKTDGIRPDGWILQDPTPAFPWDNVHFWEYNTMDLQGRPVDMSKRHRHTRILDKTKDAEVIANYSNPEWVLGWKPVVHR